MPDIVKDTDTNPPQLSADTLDPSDGGPWSRKLWFSIGAIVVIVGGGVFFAFVPGFRDGYGTLTEGVLGVCGLFLGANVGNKMVIAKHIATMTATKMQQEVSNYRADRPQPTDRHD
jgi:hypothetical protein